VRDKRRIVPVGPLTTAQRTAHVFLTGMVDRLLAQRNSRMPTLRQLATGAHVSIGTMGKVVQRLSDSGVVSSRNRQGIRLCKVTGTSCHVVQHRMNDRLEYAWERVTKTLMFDIHSGVYRKGSLLPDVKQLTNRYGVSYRTMVKALREIVQRNLVSRSGKRFLVPYPHAGGGKSVVLVTRGTPRDEFFVLSGRSVENLRTFENYCVQAGLELIVAVVNDAGIRLRQPCARYVSLEEAMQRTTVMGFVLWTMSMQVYDPGRIVHQLASYQKPVAVFDEEGSVVPPRAAAAFPPIRYFSLGNSMAPGKHVARHLLRLGHRHVAYVSTDHQSLYSRNRLTGLEQEYADAGLDRVLPSCMQAAYRSRTTASMITDLFTKLCREKWIEVLKGVEIPIPVRAVIMRDHLGEVRNRQFFRNDLYPLLESIVAGRHVSAIVCVNDITGMETIYYLNQKGCSVPNDFSVIGFDNSQVASTGNITSYDFNIAGALHLQLEFILNPRAALFSSDPAAPMEIEGFVVQRDSTALIGTLATGL
jgi:DNA-binding LacI/PurR family transcriptional regulator/DNA-binding transcriptional regulator YhcF (GntR family)